MGWCTQTFDRALPDDVHLQCSQEGPGTGGHWHDAPRCLLLQKWQRRFFILYEHGLLRYALDEMVSAAWLCPGSGDQLSYLLPLECSAKLEESCARWV